MSFGSLSHVSPTRSMGNNVNRAAKILSVEAKGR